jgi:hypothetical protein
LPRDPNRHWHLFSENRKVKHPPAPLVKEEFTSAATGASVAVLVRTHKADAKFEDLMHKLETGRTGFDLYPIVDNTRPVTVSGYDRVIWHSIDAARQLGLTQTPRGLLHDCGDIPLYFAYREIPKYRHYLMIEDDVDLMRGDASYINRICTTLETPEFRGVDFAGLRLSPIASTFSWGIAAAKYFPQRHCHWAYFPVVLVSRPAVAFLFSQRQLEAVRDPLVDDVIHCETFVASALHAGGYRCLDLNELVPGGYTWESMAMQLGDLAMGRPMGSQIVMATEVEMVHPIYTHQEYLNRLHRKFIISRKGDWPNLIARLDSDEAEPVPEHLKAALREQIPPEYRPTEQTVEPARVAD